MTSRNVKRAAAFSGRAAIVLVGMVLLGSEITPRASALVAGAQNGLAGTWRVQVTVRNCSTGQPLRPTFPALFTFGGEGTLTAVTSGQSPALTTPALGVWQHTQGHNYSAVSEDFVFNAAGVLIQTHRLTRTIKISNDGDEFTDEIQLEILDTSGNTIAIGCGTSVGSRFEMSGE